MSVTLPEIDEVGYRLWRLRRLIIVGASMPALIWLVIGLVFWPFTDTPPDGYIVLWVFSAAVLSTQAVFFPNATEETLTLATALAVMTLLEPLLGFSLLARFAELGAMVAALIWLPPRMVDLLARTPARTMRSTSVLVTEVSAEKARKHFPPRPGQEFSYRLCGVADSAGIFPITLAPAGPVGLDPDRDRAGPHVWARIARDDPAEQDTEFLTRTPAGQVEPAASFRHTFDLTAKGCKVSEHETVPDFPVGLWGLLWLADYPQDGLVAARDGLEGRTTMSLRMAHRDTLKALVLGLVRPDWAANRG